jgi:hypothetical protein
VDGWLTLIDFEVATKAEDQARSTLAHPGYAAPQDRQGVDVDRYALACIASLRSTGGDPAESPSWQGVPARRHDLRDVPGAEGNG